ncbi:MAG: hypothetical protein ACKODX_06350 [Gemmata sp.]
MKQLLLATMVVGFTAGAVRAEWGGPRPAPMPPQGAQGSPVPRIGGPNTLLGQGNPYNGVAPDKYGLNPRLRKMFRLGPPSNSGQPQVPPSYYYPQMGYNQNGPAYNPTGYPTGAYGPAQGALVFPHHSFVRSPRDYFMLDLNNR